MSDHTNETLPLPTPLTGWFRKKPVVIEAMQFVGGYESASAIQAWANQRGALIVYHTAYDSLAIPKLKGHMQATQGDWIICGVKGEFYPCKPDIFAATYEPANADAEQARELSGGEQPGTAGPAQEERES